MENNDKTVFCEEHGISPYSIICDHLVYGESKQWTAVEVDDGREVIADWCCPKCYKAHARKEDPIESLTVGCMHCIRRIQAEHGYIIPDDLFLNV